MSEKQYPEWQHEMRRLQAISIAEQEEVNRKRAENEAAIELAQLEKEWQQAIDYFVKIGFTAYPSERPADNKWEVDNYVFKVDRFQFQIYRYLPKDE